MLHPTAKKKTFSVACYRTWVSVLTMVVMNRTTELKALEALVAQTIKNLLAMQETRVQSLS